MSNEQKMREAFENYASDGGKWLRAIQTDGRNYALMSTEMSWRTWQSAWQAPLADQPAPSVPDDAALLDSVAANYWKLDPIELPTGGGDADVGWRVVEYHMPDIEREVACVYCDDPRAAIRAAMRAAAPSDWVDDEGQPRVTPRPAPHKRPPPTAAEAKAMLAAAPEVKP